MSTWSSTYKPSAYLSDIRVTNISKSFTHKMAAKTSWHRYGTKLRHCHRMYITYVRRENKAKSTNERLVWLPLPSVIRTQPNRMCKGPGSGTINRFGSTCTKPGSEHPVLAFTVARLPQHRTHIAKVKYVLRNGIDEEQLTIHTQ